MKSLSIDIETYGSVDLIKSGVYAYANAPDFKILLFAYAFDDEEVKITDLAQGEALPKEVMNALTDEDILKTAYNANFERTCIGKYFNINLPVNQWRCSAVQASELGLPLSLSAVAVALGLEEQKDKRGKALIDYFSKPCKPTKTNGGRTRNLPTHAPDKWEVFKEYCIQDVEVERAIKKKLAQFPICDSEQKLWTYDQRINDRGVRVDRNFVENAIKYNQPGGSVQITISRSNGKAILRVADTGCGIPDEYRTSIFEPFFRVDKSRSREMGGAGLGLALVREIAALHGGTVQDEPAEGAGTVFTVALPM